MNIYNIFFLTITHIYIQLVAMEARRSYVLMHLFYYMETIKLQVVLGVIVFSVFRYDLRNQKIPTIPLEFVVGVPVVGLSPTRLGL
jgi:hypothetical protein